MMKTDHNISEERRKDGCPFGHVCDQCNLYRPMYVTDDKGNVSQEMDCQFNNVALLLSETKAGVRGVQAATETFRNEMVRDNGAIAHLLVNNQRVIENDS